MHIKKHPPSSISHTPNSSYLIDIFTENLQQDSVRDALTDLAEAFLEGGITNPDLIKVWLDWSVSIREKVWKDYQNLQDELHKRVRKVLNRAKRENLCCVPLLRKAERIAIPKSSRLVSIFHNLQLFVILLLAL